VSSSSRVVFVDLLRFVAALQMLQGHTVAALLAPEYRHGAVYGLWSTARGLTSVAFLFAAGLSFYLATERESAADSGGRGRVMRALRLVGLGYLLHLPVALFTGADATTRARALHELAAVDVLQCIGVSMVLLEGLRVAVSNARARVAASVALAAALFALAPWAAELQASGTLRPLLAYATPAGGSLFPLAPWAAHVFAGFACGAVVRRPASTFVPEPEPVPVPDLARPRTARDLFRRSLGIRLAAIAALASLFAAACIALPVPPVLRDHSSRLAGVLLAAWVLWFAGERLARVPSAIAVLAQQTLVLYVFHVLLVYGQGVGLASWLGPRLGPGGAFLATLLVVGASAAVALGYDRLARARRTG
jgi:uncharacterized membrane protein